MTLYESDVDWGESSHSKLHLTLEDLDRLPFQEAESYLEELINDIQHIQSQLGARTRRAISQQRKSLAEYEAWRQSALHALTCKSRQYRHLKARVKRIRSTQSLVRPSGGEMTTVEVLAAAHTFIMHRIRQLLPLSESEEMVVRQIRECISRERRKAK